MFKNCLNLYLKKMLQSDYFLKTLCFFDINQKLTKKIKNQIARRTFILKKRLIDFLFDFLLVSWTL